MRIIDGIKKKGYGVRIPNCSRRDLPRFCKQMGYTVGAEIGVQRGAFTRKFLLEGIKMYAIDSWLSYPDYCATENYQDHQDKVYQGALQELSKYPHCTIVKKTSMEAVKDFEDNSLDFVYIDGHHGFKYVTEDIWEWSKKVRVGGMISGHDYAYPKQRDLPEKMSPYTCQVKFVIDAYTKAFFINNWWVLGADKRTTKEESRDRWRSWMWFKER